MNKHHREILEEIKKIDSSNPKISNHFNLNKYMGTTRHIYNITNPQIREIAKTWAKENKDISLDDFLIVLNSFFKGESHNEKSFGGKLLEYFPKLRKDIQPNCIDTWLTGAQGWGEVDSLCQSSFTAKEILDKWNEWKKLLIKLNNNKDIHKRRASLVLLTKSVRESNDEKLSNLAFENIDKLKNEKDILITKAISWLLRDLTKNYRQQVENYLKENQSTLPKIAIRETTKKLQTGRK